MKKVMLILGILCLFVFVGCGQGGKSEQPAKDESKTATESMKEKAGETVETAKEKSQEVVEVAKEITEDTTEAMKEKEEAAVEIAAEKSQEAVEVAKEKTEDTTEAVKEKTERVLSETNMSPDVIKQIQKALQNAGHDPKYIDGVIGWRTTEAIKAYQKEKGLSVAGLTHETIKSLGIKLGE